ncbi:hypothetical protein QUB10_21540 [Microcoleus sp. B5-D4]
MRSQREGDRARADLSLGRACVFLGYWKRASDRGKLRAIGFHLSGKM